MLSKIQRFHRTPATLLNSRLNSAKTWRPKRRPIQPTPRPEHFTQTVILSDGATFTIRGTSPNKSQVRLTRDVRSHPLWNPSLLREGVGDESGQLSRFSKKFGGGTTEALDLQFLESDEALPESTATNTRVASKTKGKKK